MATDFARFFKADKRDNGERFVTLTDDRPEWLQEAVWEAHSSSLPNDWIYEECYRAVQTFDENGLDEDALHDHADSRVDVYTRELYRWAADMCLTDTWANAESEASDMGTPDETERRIAVIQYSAIRQIAYTMREACQAAADAVDDAAAEQEVHDDVNT